MGLVEGILGEIRHIVVYLLRRLLRNPSRHAARHILLRIAVDKVLPLLLHHILLLLAHGTAHQIAPAQRIAAQVPHDLHHLLLVHDTAVGRRKDRLQLRTGIADCRFAVFPLYIPGNKLHGPRTEQRYPGYNILKILRLQFLHKVSHPAALQLEYPLRPAGADGGKHFIVVEFHVIHVRRIAAPLGDHPAGILDHPQVSEPQKVHLEKSQLLYRRHRKLRHDRSVLGSGQGHKILRRLLADHHPRRMHGHIPRKSLQPPAHIDQPSHLLIALIELFELRVDRQRPVDRDIQLSRNHLGDGIHKGVGQLHHTAHVADHRLRCHGPEGDDLNHSVLAVFLPHIIDHILSSLIPEVHIDIRHGDPLRI